MDKIGLKSRINLDTLKEKMESFNITYNDKRDTLILRSPKASPAISVDCGGLYWLRVNPETAEIVGIEIEDYRRVFVKRMKQYESLSKVRSFPREPFISDLSQSLQAGCLA